MTIQRNIEQVHGAAREYSDVLRLLADNNYLASIADTGGGCESIEVSLPNGGRILINDKNELLAWERINHRGWFAGFYDGDDKFVCSASTDDGSAEGLVLLLDQLAAGVGR
ncbi:hypothetical protein ACWDSJ_14370 [Nocardia sp. NPDC003482]